MWDIKPNTTGTGLTNGKHRGSYRPGLHHRQHPGKIQTETSDPFQSVQTGRSGSSYARIECVYVCVCVIYIQVSLCLCMTAGGTDSVQNQ